MNPGTVIPYRGIAPQLADEVYLAGGSFIIGDVVIGRGSSVWFNTVIRGDVNTIRIGSYTNIQDGSMVHVQPRLHPVVIGDRVTIGHHAIIHGCTIGDNCLIGMGAIIMNGCTIGDNCIIGAGTLLPENKVIPANSLVTGSPGRILRAVSPEHIQMLRDSSVHYYELSLSYKTADEWEGT